MFKFLVWHVLIVTSTCELFKDESGYVLDYAPKYDNYKPRDYHFNYAVSDPHTGDHKSQWEVKINGVVRGGYSLLEPDGTTRVVEYIADDDGFRAVVNKLGTAVHPEVVPVVPEVTHHSAYDGQVTNYAPTALYSYEQNVGTTILNHPQTISTADVVPVNIEPAVQSHSTIIQQEPVITQNHNLATLEVPHVGTIEAPIQTQGHDFGSIGAYTLETGLGTGAQFGKLEVVPFEAVPQDWARSTVDKIDLRRQDLGQIDLSGVQNIRSTGSTQRPPVQKFQLGGLSTIPTLNRYDITVGRAQAVPIAQGQSGSIGAVPLQGQVLDRVVLPQSGIDINLSPSVDNANLQGYLSGIEVNNLHRAVPLFQSYGSGVNNLVLPQPQIEIHASRPEVPSYQGQVVPNVVPVDPSYRTTIEYQGLADDGLRRDVYHASYSEKVLKVVPSPNKKEKHAKKEFLIYYPDSESH